MQCVILAAGRGQRMRPLTDDIPKPLIKVAGQTILSHIVAALPPVIDELVVVVGYKSEQIKEHCGDYFCGRKITYVGQADFAGGTGDALLQAKDVITGRFLFMYADDLHGADALKHVVEKDHAMLGMHSDTPERFGVLLQNEDGTLKEIIEKPENPPSSLVNIGGFVVTPEILEYAPGASSSDELYVTDMLTEYASKHKVKIIKQDRWIPIGYPEDIEKAERILDVLSGK